MGLEMPTQRPKGKHARPLPATRAPSRDEKKQGKGKGPAKRGEASAAQAPQSRVRVSKKWGNVARALTPSLPPWKERRKRPTTRGTNTRACLSDPPASTSSVPFSFSFSFSFSFLSSVWLVTGRRQVHLARALLSKVLLSFSPSLFFLPPSSPMN